jgi:hypothetical protein
MHPLTLKTFTLALILFIGTLLTLHYWFLSDNFDFDKDDSIHTKSVTPTTSSSSSAYWMMQPHSMNHGINYLLETDTFLATLSSCIQDDKCHIQYLHTEKTGGTTIEKSIFRSIFPNNKIHGCCGEKNMKQFRNNSYDACMKPFNSHQVMGKDFQEIVQTCLQIYHQHNHTKNDNYKVKDHGNDDRGIHKKNSTNTTSGWVEDNTLHRMVILATFRDPIQRTLSAIHQICNKVFDKRSPRTQQACSQCSYEKDTEFWDNHTTHTNQLYDSLYKDVILWQEEKNKHVNPTDNGAGVGVGIVDLKLLTLDNVDITPCFTKLVDWLSPPYSIRLREIQDKHQVKNPELLQRCDFGFHSVMMKHLAPSIAIYRNLTLGH